MITALFAVVTAGLLILWVVGAIDSTETKDLIVKLAAVSGIVAALSAVLQIVVGSSKK